MRPVDQRVDAPAVQLADQLLDRKDERRRAGDVIEQGQPRAGRDAAQHGLGHLAGRSDRQRQRRLDHRRRAPPGHVAGHVAAGVIVVRADQDLVAGLELQRAQHAVDPAGGVVNENQVGRWGADQFGQPPARLVQQRRELAHEKLDRLALDQRRNSCCRSSTGRGHAPNEP